MSRNPGADQRLLSGTLSDPTLTRRCSASTHASLNALPNPPARAPFAADLTSLRCRRSLFRRVPPLRPLQERLTAQQALAHPWLHAEGDVKIQNEVVVRLRQYASHQKFHKLGLMALVRHLDKDEVEGLRHIFTEMDADKSGQISPKDFRDGLRRRGCSMPPDELAQLMRARARLSFNSTSRLLRPSSCVLRALRGRWHQPRL